MFEQCGGNWQGSRLLISKDPGFEPTSSPYFFVFHLLRGQMGLSYFFFWCGPSQGRSQNWTWSALGQWAVAKPDLPWDNGL